MNTIPHINNVEEVAKYFQKSPSWVYKNWEILGGRKLGGSLFFPSEEDLYGSIFRKKEEEVEIRLHHEGDQVHECLVRNEEGSYTGRSKKKGGDKESKTKNDGTDRHGLFRTGK